MGNMKNYDPKLVGIVFAGIPITGFADGSFLSVETNEDWYTAVVGSDGEGCRSKNNNWSARFTVTLGQWSLANDLLTAIMNTDRLSPSGDGIGPFMVKDLKGTTLIAAEKAWIVKPPTVEYDREPTSREWVFETIDASFHVGGNLP